MPFTFPPEKFYGLMVSGLGTPDLRGSQGSFSFYSDAEGKTFDVSDGVIEQLQKISGDPINPNTTIYKGLLKGPANPFKQGNHPLSIPFKLTIDKETNTACFEIGTEKVTLEPGKLSHWLRVEFKTGIIKIGGIVQLVLESLEPVKLYFSPVNIDPEKPAMPITHPKILSVYLSKLLGPYATLGMAEDTSAVNEGVLTLESLLDQTYHYQKERERIFFDTLNKYKQGLMVQVFEATDRVQHMFWQFLENPNLKVGSAPASKRAKNAVYDVYKAMDDFLGELLPKLTPNDLFMIVSDHGFNSAKREFHLNSWLHKEGYLVLKDGKTTSDKWYADVDWSKSKAYGQGLNGLFLNIKGREKYGIVNTGKEAEQLKEEIKQKLIAVTDNHTGKPVMKAVYKREELYKGPYTQNAPDVVVGYSIGFKVAWESAVNFVGGEIFADNKKMWTGDHCFTSDQVPGIFYCNKKITTTNPTLADISPTVLTAFGIPIPSFIDGRNLGVQK
ncbi:MAG: alkaline phosphatase family protein [Acidobacteria bacterium]|nr:alkaline phosphatase family protein [Acidobacteriota bacterium]